ncbi:subtilisin-like protease SBT1.7 precursor [Nicotiana tabacum]|uniref:Serine protease n=1 Tax=Nicotiana tabacum TaxID=4097 RepID=C3PTS6_TOBAC|nr:subtilisin-like protease SBT1.7 precursor [Nicotiana tabacum]ABG37022.1 serine protease [Nicotiana tabacum]
MKILKIFLVFSILGCLSWPSIQSDLTTYIVQVESPESRISTQSLSDQDLESWYRSFLPNTIASTRSNDEEEPRLVYSYRNVMKGFAARLSAEQVKEMEKKEGFISAWPERILSLHTTHTPSFLGLQQNEGVWRHSNYGKGVIIGVLDTGISPDHPSFSDEGMPPPPAKWKGKCELNFTTKCNNKLIGARTFPQANGSPIDDNGHGTHTAGTAAGGFVKGANVFGNANGTAVGIAPLAHLAIYKVCDSFGCSDSGILSAMDAAIDDGVDILSLSLGGSTNPFHSDPIALGAYSATQRGILVSCSAGNTGPFEGAVVNEAPWILTVGASTLDRKIKATVRLGNKEEFEGESAFHPKVSKTKFFPLFNPGENLTDDSDNSFCGPGLTDLSRAIKGKIVLCVAGGGFNSIEKGQAVKNAGGVGMILINRPQDGLTKSADAHVLPALDVASFDGNNIIDYMKSTKKPVARITFQGTIIGDKNAPVLAGFSSRGPSTASPGILKPDIIGPGVNVLAAWPTPVENKTNTKSTFNIISGTSMSCPHLSGIAALLKSAHPTWSPAAIKSAIMTTADIVNLGNESLLDEMLAPAKIFAYGSGHVNPSRANDPGLVYDTQFKDYIPYLCGLNYTDRQMGNILQRITSCSKVKSIPEAQLNYPSFSISLGANQQTYTRTVTNVGEAKSSYRVEIVSPRSVSVVVKPSTLKFTKLNQKLTYRVTFSATTNITNMEVVHGYLKWSSNRHFVRSPIAVILQESETPED